MNIFESFLTEGSTDFMSMPGHPYAFKAAYDYNTGHAIKITYDISGPGFKVYQIGPVGVAMDTSNNWIQLVRDVVMGDFFNNSEGERKRLLAGLNPKNVRNQKELELTVENIRKRGHLDFTGSGCKVVQIYDRVTKKELTDEVQVIGSFSLKKKSPLAIPEHLIPEWKAGKLGRNVPFQKGFLITSLQVGGDQSYPTFMSTHWFTDLEEPMKVTEEYAKKFGYALDQEGYAIYPDTKKRVLFDLASTKIANVEFYDFDDQRASKTKHRDMNSLQGTVIGDQEVDELSAPGLTKKGISVLTDRAAKPLATVQTAKFDNKHNGILGKLLKMDTPDQLRELMVLKNQDPSLYSVVKRILGYMEKRQYVALHSYMNGIRPMWESAESGIDLFEQYLTEAPGDEGAPPPVPEDPGMPPDMGDGAPPPDMGGMDPPPDLGGMGDLGGMDGGLDTGDGGMMGDPNADMSEGEGQDLNQLLNLPEKVSAIMNLKLHERFLNLLNTIGAQLQSIKNNADVLNALSKDSIDIVNHLKKLDENVRLYLKNNFIHENYSKNLLFFNKCLNLLKLLNDAFDRDIHKGIRDAE